MQHIRKLASAGIGFGALFVGLPQSAIAEDWSGFYVGTSAGYAFGHVKFNDGSETRVSANGIVVTNYAGYNFQRDGIVFGIEGEFTAHGGDDVDGNAEDLDDKAANVDYAGAVRARLGVDRGDHMPWVSLGIAMARIEGFDSDFAPDQDDKTFTGWTVGTGIDFRILPGWALRAEYAYTDYGTEFLNFEGGENTELDTHVLRIGLNYQPFNSETRVDRSTSSCPTCGFYVGAYAGHGWGDADVLNLDDGDDGSSDIDAAVFGGLVGYNVQRGMMIVGLEAELGGYGGDVADGINFNDEVGANLNYTGALRGRIGVKHGRFVPFVAAGLAFGRAELFESDDLGGTDTIDSKLLVGWTAGVGTDIILSDNWSSRIEYLYSDYGSENFVFDGDNHDGEFDTHVFRSGLTYRFDSHLDGGMK